MPDQREPTAGGLHWEAAFATHMRELRGRRGWSQTALADRLWDEYHIKLDGSAITRIEKNADGPDGARLIRLGEAAAIAGVLGSNLDEMMRAVPDLDDQYQTVWINLVNAESNRDAALESLSAITRQVEFWREQMTYIKEKIAEKYASKEAAD